MTKHRDRARKDAECGFTAEILDAPCGDCKKKMKPGADVFYFPHAGESGEGLHVGACCVDRYLLE